VDEHRTHVPLGVAVPGEVNAAIHELELDPGEWLRGFVVDDTDFDLDVS